MTNLDFMVESCFKSLNNDWIEKEEKDQEGEEEVVMGIEEEEVEAVVVVKETKGEEF